MTERIVFAQSVVTGEAPVLNAFVSHEAARTVAIAAGQQGPAGPSGIPGPAGGTAMNFTATAAIGGRRMLSLNAANEVIYASNDDIGAAHKIIGMSLNAASPGGAINVVRGGEVIEPSWNWVTTLPVYLGTNGLLTQTPPAAPAAFSLIVGFPTSATGLFISVREPIII